MYRAKDSGRNCMAFYDESMHERIAHAEAYHPLLPALWTLALQGPRLELKSAHLVPVLRPAADGSTTAERHLLDLEAVAGDDLVEMDAFHRVAPWAMRFAMGPSSGSARRPGPRSAAWTGSRSSRTERA